MKLAYLTGQYPKVSHTFIRREILGLEELGHEVVRLSVREADSGIADPLDQAERMRTRTFFTAPRRQWLGALVRRLRADPLGLLREGLRGVSLWRRPGPGLIQRMAYLIEAVFFLEILEREQVEHVHAHFGRNAASVAQIMHRLGGPGFSMTVHGPDEFDDPRGFELGEKVRDSRFTVAISAYTTAQLRRWVAIPDWPKLHVVRCSVDESFFEPAEPIAAGDRTFVCVGRLCAQKGQLILLEAFAEVAAGHPEARLLFAGDGEMRADVEARARALGIQDRIEITGWISEQEVRACLRRSLCMVLPSFAEGLPVVIMEALAMGRPVISTYTAGIPELVDHQDGWLVPAGDAESLAQAMCAALAAEPTELDALGRCGAQRVRERHYVKTEVARLSGLLTGERA